MDGAAVTAWQKVSCGGSHQPPTLEPLQLYLPLAELCPSIRLVPGEMLISEGSCYFILKDPKAGDTARVCGKAGSAWHGNEQCLGVGVEKAFQIQWFGGHLAVGRHLAG